MPTQNIQEIHDRLNASKRERRAINKRINEGFAQSKPYQEVLEQLSALKAKKAQMEAAIEQEYAEELRKVESLKASIDADVELLTDVSLTMLMKGETVEVTDAFDNKYEPEFKVRFKRA